MINEQKNLLELIEKKERKARFRTVIYSVIPIILALILIIFSGNKIKELNNIKIERNNYLRETDSLKQTIKKLQVKLDNSTNFVSNLHQVDWATAKMLASKYSKQATLLETIMQMKRENIKWKIGSINPNSGFDSPSFATYIINHYSKTRIDESKRYELQKNTETINKPDIGDLIFYSQGYAMFYFKDQNNQPFCIGMTPAGIISVNVDFGPKILGYGKVNY